MHHPPVAFLKGFLELVFVHRVSVCLTGNEPPDDGSSKWLAEAAAGLGRVQQVGLAPIDQILEVDSWPSKEERMLIVCPDFDWEREYPKWSYEKNVIWLVAQADVNGTEELTWSNNLRLDSRFFIYSEGDTNAIHALELFRIKGGPIITQFYGTWFTSSEHMYVPEPSIWERRTNLHGAEIVDTVLEWKPFMNLDAGGNFSLANGVMVDMLSLIASSLNFTVRRYSPPDGQWGFLNETSGSMTGLIGELSKGLADVATPGLYVTEERQDFSDMFAVVSDFTTIIVPKSLAGSGAQINALAYVNIFSGTTWLTLLLASVLVMWAYMMSSVALTADGREVDVKKTALQGVLEGFQVAYLTLMQISLRVSLESTAVRVVFVTASMVAFVMYSYYCGDLTALMTHKPPPVTIRSFQDILDAGYSTRVVRGTSMENWFAFADPDSAMGQLYRLMLDDPSLMSDGFTELQEDLMASTDSVAFDTYLGYTGVNWATPLLNFNERVPAHVGWAFQYNSELSEVFQYHLTRMKERGITVHIMDEWLSGRPDEMDHRIFVDDATPLGYNNLIFPMVIILSGVCLSLTIFALELCKRMLVVDSTKNKTNNNKIAPAAAAAKSLYRDRDVVVMGVRTIKLISHK